MGFGNKTILSSRVLDGSDYLNNIDPQKLEELSDEVTNLIEQLLGITAPDNPDDAPAILRGIWADITLFKSIKWQKNISEEEIKRRTILKDDAFKLLDKIKAGNITLTNNGTNLINSNCPVVISGTKRIGTL